MTVTLRYFSWVRERVGKTDETLALPPEVTSIERLIGWLAERGEQYAHAFENPAIIRAAIDRKHVPAQAPIAGAREIAFFPPMTGG
jgi:molybdopterin synthase sulfur carrier subunit